MRGRLPIGALVFALVVSLLPVVLADAPPHVRITSPAGGSTVNGTTAISGNAWDDVQVAGVKVRIDDGAWWVAADTSGNGTWWTWSTSWDTTRGTNGGHRIGAVAW